MVLYFNKDTVLFFSTVCFLTVSNLLASDMKLSKPFKKLMSKN